MLNVLMIGCGNIAGGFDADSAPGVLPRTHAGAYTADHRFALKACVEPDEERRLAFMHRWNVRDGYASMHDLGNARGSFDIISICSPTEAHHADALAAIALAPKLIFCEKPLCDDLAMARDVVSLCRNNGVLLAVNHNRRWDPGVARLRSELASGFWGRLRSVTCHYNKGVLNNGSHMIDMLHELLGPLTLLRVGQPLPDYRDSDPSIPATLVTREGVEVGLHCGHAADYALFELQFVTERGVIVMEDGGLRWRTRLAQTSPQFPGYRSLPEGSIAQGSYLQTMSAAVANIHDAVVHGDTLASTGDTALAAQIMCHRMREAASY